MTTRTKNVIRVFEKVLSDANRTLGLTQQEIKQSFPSDVVHPIHIKSNKVKRKAEIRLHDEGATLCSIFEDDELCHSTYLFFDSLEFAQEYIRYLNKNYLYDFLKSSWILPDNHVSICRTKDNLVFICTK